MDGNSDSDGLVAERDGDGSGSSRPSRQSPAMMTSALFPPPPLLSTTTSSSVSASSSPPPLHLTVRFLSLPDIQLDIADPQRMTVVGLKTLIRRQLKAAADAATASSSASSTTTTQKPQPPPNSASSSPTLQDAHRRRLRVIAGGKILADDAVLAHVLRPVPPPPRAGRSPSVSVSVSTTAASTPVDNHSANHHHLGTSRTPPLDDAPARVYVSCSLGDVLPASELAAEAAAASGSEKRSRSDSSPSSPTALQPSSGGSSRLGGGVRFGRTATTQPRVGGGGGGGSSSSSNGPLRPPMGGRATASSSSSADAPPPPSGTSSSPPRATTTTTPPPRGFERLLQAGFTAAEVNQLRLQFRSIQATRFTPDAMPSPDSLRTMEDNWLDNNQAMAPPAGGAGGGSGFGGGGGSGSGGTNLDGTGDNPVAVEEEFGMPGLLDVLVRGMLVGFLFPLGSTCWLAREEGLWTRRWRAFVSFGVVLSLAIGTIKTLAGEW